MNRGRPKGYKMSEESINTLKDSLSKRTNYFKRKVSIDGFVFSSVSEAANAKCVSISTVCYRIKKQWPGWYYL